MSDAERQVADANNLDEARPTEEFADAADEDVAAADAGERANGTAPDEEADDGAADDLDEQLARDPRSRRELFVALQEAEATRDEYLDDVRRARAEFDNYRRRVMREGAIQVENGKAIVVEELLEVLDDLDRTLEAAEQSEDQGLAKGVEMVASKLMRSLEGLGVERLDQTDVDFDPNVHEAVQQKPADEPRDEPVVAEVLRPGYRMGDRVLRAAMVVVAQ